MLQIRYLASFVLLPLIVVAASARPACAGDDSLGGFGAAWDPKDLEAWAKKAPESSVGELKSWLKYFKDHIHAKQKFPPGSATRKMIDAMERRVAEIEGRLPAPRKPGTQKTKVPDNLPAKRNTGKVPALSKNVGKSVQRYGGKSSFPSAWQKLKNWVKDSGRRIKNVAKKVPGLRKFIPGVGFVVGIGTILSAPANARASTAVREVAGGLAGLVPGVGGMVLTPIAEGIAVRLVPPPEETIADGESEASPAEEAGDGDDSIAQGDGDITADDLSEAPAELTPPELPHYAGDASDFGGDDTAVAVGEAVVETSAAPTTEEPSIPAASGPDPSDGLSDNEGTSSSGFDPSIFTSNGEPPPAPVKPSDDDYRNQAQQINNQLTEQAQNAPPANYGYSGYSGNPGRTFNRSGGSGGGGSAGGGSGSGSAGNNWINTVRTINRIFNNGGSGGGNGSAGGYGSAGGGGRRNGYGSAGGNGGGRRNGNGSGGGGGRRGRR